jgi:hypothetical protein
VHLAREPHNPYDNNAIAVLNQAGEKIGHVPRLLAAELAGPLDAGILALSERLAAPGEPNYESSRELVAPTLNLWFFGDLGGFNEYRTRCDEKHLIPWRHRQ